MLLISLALAAPSWTFGGRPDLPPPPEVEVCQQLRGTLIDRVVEQVLTNRLPYRNYLSGPATPPPATPPSSLPQATVRDPRRPAQQPGAIRGPQRDRPARLVSDGARVYLSDVVDRVTRVYALDPPGRLLATLDTVGELLLSPDGLLLVASYVSDDLEPIPAARPDNYSWPQNAQHQVHASRISAWDVRGELSQAPLWTLDLEGGLVGLWAQAGRVQILSASLPLPSLSAWDAAFSLQEGFPAPLPGPGTSVDEGARLAWAEARERGEALLRARLGALSTDQLLAPRARWRLNASPWSTLAPNCAALEPGLGGADLFLSVATLPSFAPGAARYQRFTLGGDLPRFIRFQGDRQGLWLVAWNLDGTDVHLLQDGPDGPTRRSARIAGKAGRPTLVQAPTGSHGFRIAGPIAPNAALLRQSRTKVRFLPGALPSTRWTSALHPWGRLRRVVWTRERFYLGNRLGNSVFSANRIPWGAAGGVAVRHRQRAGHAADGARRATGAGELDPGRPAGDGLVGAPAACAPRRQGAELAAAHGQARGSAAE